MHPGFVPGDFSTGVPDMNSESPVQTFPSGRDILAAFEGSAAKLLGSAMILAVVGDGGVVFVNEMAPLGQFKLPLDTIFVKTFANIDGAMEGLDPDGSLVETPIVADLMERLDAQSFKANRMAGIPAGANLSVDVLYVGDTFLKRVVQIERTDTEFVVTVTGPASAEA